METWAVNNLTVSRLDEHGAWLVGGGAEVLLPKRELSEEIRSGENLDVYIYRDDERLLATRMVPRVAVGEIALLEVADVNPVGAFLDWGLPKQLLVPYSEQIEPMRSGRRYLVKVCRDDRDRVIGSTRLERYLEQGAASYSGGEEVDILLWRFTPLGAAVIVDDHCEGLLYRDEVHSKMRAGDCFQGRISRVRDDGKLDVTLRKSSREERSEAQELLLEKLREQGGFLPLHDKSPPEEIYQQLGLSKKLFKKALGGLLKRGVIKQLDGGIRLQD